MSATQSHMSDYCYNALSLWLLDTVWPLKYYHMIRDDVPALYERILREDIYAHMVFSLSIVVPIV